VTFAEDAAAVLHSQLDAPANTLSLQKKLLIKLKELTPVAQSF
jgi:hypothetical protein